MEIKLLKPEELTPEISEQIAELFSQLSPRKQLQAEEVLNGQNTIYLASIIESEKVFRSSDTRDFVFEGGEDYELLLTMSPDQWERCSGIGELSEIGVVEAGDGQVLLDGETLEAKGWDPF